MADNKDKKENNPGQPQSPTIYVQNQPQISQPAQPSASPGQHQTINIYTQPPPSQSPQQTGVQQAPVSPPPAQPPPQQPPPQQPPPQQPPPQQPPQEQRPIPAPLPVGYYGLPPTPAERNRYRCYEIMKVVQIVVCVFFIALGIIWSFLFFFVDDWPWRFFPYKRERRWDDDYRQRYWDDDYYNSPLDSYIWAHVLASIFGLIGAAGEVVCCQVTYAILVTFSIPYCILPWAIVCGMCNDWSKPRYYYGVYQY